MDFRCPACNESVPYERPEETPFPGGDAETIDGVRCPACGFIATPPELRGTISFKELEDAAAHTRIAHFVLVRLLGRGSFGAVWLANDVALDRQVALKVAVPRQGDAADLLHEAQASARLRHPNIVAVYEVGSADERVYIASEFVDGLNLHDVLTQGRLKVEASVRMLRDVAHALHHAHEHGIVHRDVKPANILVDREGRPHVADFGIAKRVAANATISTDGQVVGTALYMSPEQASGLTRETDRRSDVYALGVILFELLTGHVPFRGNTRAVLHQKVYNEAPSPRTLVPSLPRDLETICLRCLEREPGRRYATALDVAREFERFLAGEPIEARPITSLERAWRWCRRRPAIAGLIAGLFLSLTTGLAGVTYFWLQSEGNARRAEEQAERTAESLYRSQMNLASAYIAAGDLVGVRSVLSRFDDGQPLADLRGFEWRYFDHVAAAGTEVANVGEVVDVAISLDGEFCAACSPDGVVRIWRTRTGEAVRELAIDGVDFRSVEFAPTANLLAAGGSDGIVRVWNPIESDVPVDYWKHGPKVEHVSFSPDGRRVLSVGFRGATRVRTIGGDTFDAEIPVGQALPFDAEFSPDGEQVAIATNDGFVRLWTVGERPARLEIPVVARQVVWSPDGRELVTGSYSGDVRVFSTEDGAKRTELAADFRIGDVSILGRTGVLATLTNDNRLRTYDVDTLRERGRVPAHNLGFGTMALSADGRHLVVGSGDGSVRTFRTADLARRNVHWIDATVAGLRGARTIAFLADGKRFVAGGADGVPHLRDVDTGEAVVPPKQPGSADGLLVVPGPTVSLLDRRTGATMHDLWIARGGMVLATLSPDGRSLAVAHKDSVTVYDVGAKLERRLEIPPGDAAPEALVFLPGEAGDLVITRGDGTVRFHSSLDGTPRDTVLDFESAPTALAVCEHGRALAIGTDRGVVHVWDLARSRTRHASKVHASRVNAMAVLPNGTTIVSGGRDRDVVLSDSLTGEPIARLTDHDRQVFGVAVSPDGSLLASGGLEGDVRIWHSTPAPAPAARSR